VKNVTITLDEETARWARVEAARRDMSMTRFVGQMLRERMTAAEAYETAMEEYLSRSGRALKDAGEHYPARDELHERADLR
jgi:hypothetical protein